jgi:hypothetical protein
MCNFPTQFLQLFFKLLFQLLNKLHASFFPGQNYHYFLLLLILYVCVPFIHNLIKLKFVAGWSINIKREGEREREREQRSLKRKFRYFLRAKQQARWSIDFHVQLLVMFSKMCRKWNLFLFFQLCFFSLTKWLVLVASFKSWKSQLKHSSLGR